MTTAKQKASARKNIQKAQGAWRSMPSRARAKAQPERRRRTEPGATGEGEFYHSEGRPKTEFATFRTQDVGKRGGIERVAGKRSRLRSIESKPL